MKKVSRRALFALALAAVLAVGTLAFCVKYAANAEKWVTFSGSPHVYTGTNLTGGKIYDRSGVRILNTTDGRVYSTDEAVREATVHLLGDRYGYISAPLLGNFAEQMIGYDKITGLNEASKGTASARLTISAEVQKAALQALGSYHGAVGVYNYKTGEILCAVTSPSYDPDNIPDIAGDETGTYDGVYLNRFFDAAYTPGSIFKLVTSAAALEQSASAQAGTHTCAGKTIIGGQEIICMSSHGTLAMPEALAHSCNVYYGELAASLGKDALQAVCDKLGLNGTLTCDGYTARSTVDLSDADDGSVAWAGIGQYTDQITAIQFLRFMGAAVWLPEPPRSAKTTNASGYASSSTKPANIASAGPFSRSAVPDLAQTVRLPNCHAPYWFTTAPRIMLPSASAVSSDSSRPVVFVSAS